MTSRLRIDTQAAPGREVMCVAKKKKKAAKKKK
jgi:hypothetical protein